MIQSIEQVSNPIIGEHYSVKCLVERNLYDTKEIIYPVIDHLHNDKENGQLEPHYHIDYRFIKVDEGGYPINNHTKHVFAPDSLRIFPTKDMQFCHIILPLIRIEQLHITPASLVSNSKLKHNCIWKGKCPHRGYDLINTNAVDGVIKCPLHGLRFEAETGELLTKLYPGY